MVKKNQSDNEVEVKQEKLVIDKFAGVKTIDTGNAFIKCHTFKLLFSNMLKNVSFNPKDPILVPMEHSHIYHTVDSSGKELTASNPVGGHYHEMKVNVIDGEWVVECSPAISGKSSSELVGTDNHTHQVRYLKTEVVQMRVASQEAMKMISNFLREPTVQG